jgi:hypothetical protein
MEFAEPRQGRFLAVKSRFSSPVRPGIPALSRGGESRFIGAKLGQPAFDPLNAVTTNSRCTIRASPYIDLAIMREPVLDGLDAHLFPAHGFHRSDGRLGRLDAGQAGDAVGDGRGADPAFGGAGTFAAGGVHY